MNRPAEATKAEPQAPKSPALPFTVFVACAVALWDFVLIFRGWVVASQSEVLGITIFFFFLGVLPWFGIIGAARQQMWGPTLVISSTLIAATGLFFIKLEEWENVPFFFLIAFAPMIGVGLALRRCLARSQIHSAKD